LSGKKLTILPFSRLPNFTKFEHNTSIGVAMKTFKTEEFLKFYTVRGHFFQKRKNFSKMFNVLRLQAAIIPQ